MSQYTHPLVGAVTLNSAKHLKRISISVRGSGEVRLNYPTHITMHQALDLLESRVEWILRAKKRFESRTKAMPCDDSQIERLRKAAKDDLPQRIQRLSQITGLKYNRLTLRATKTRWGSCTSSKNISLSIFLMSLPEHLRDFIILHELCHTVHMNHSAQFHALLNSLVGGKETQFNRELRQYSIK